MIRKAILADIPQIAEIERSSFVDPWDISLFHDALASKDKSVLVMETEGRIAGYVIMEVVLDEAHITDLAVGKSFRREGKAEALVKKVLDLASDSNVKSVLLEVREKNEAAIGLYRKFGFKELSRRKAYYQKTNEDAIVLRLEI